MKIINKVLLIAILLALISLFFLFKSCFGIGESKENTFKMSSYELIKTQKLQIAEVEGKAQGIYGYKKVLVTNLPFIGPRRDTMCWDCPGSRYVHIDGNVIYDIGYNCQEGDNLFSKNAIGKEIETKDEYSLSISTEFTMPRILRASIRCFPRQSNSFFSGDISDEEFYEYLDEASNIQAQKIILDETDFFYSAYVQGISALMYNLLKVTKPNKKINLSINVNGKEIPVTDDFSPQKKSINIDVGKTIFQE